MKYFILLLLSCMALQARSQNTKPYTVIAYYSGGPNRINTIRPKMLTHVIYSFCHLKGNQLHIGDSLTIRKLVALKQENPQLKVLLSLGGWGGCATCSDVFNSSADRKAFALSVKQANDQLGTDGIDLDWEYPAIPGHPGHTWRPEDRGNFTALVQELRKALGKKHEISFAAGGFQDFLEKSIDWKPVMKVTDRVNLMTYDLVHGASTVTGHHTPLYSTAQGKESADNAVNYLIKIGVPANKLVVGAAFYGRVFKDVPGVNNGIYQPGVFKQFLNAKDMTKGYSQADGFAEFWDGQAKAAYKYNAAQKLFLTYEDARSIALKTQYVMDKKLNGIMFWEISIDDPQNSLLGTINETMGKKKD